jgi:hypothetical protein
VQEPTIRPTLASRSISLSETSSRLARASRELLEDSRTLRKQITDLRNISRKRLPPRKSREV